MSKLINFINEILDEDKYDDKFNSTIAERLDTFSLRQLDQMHSYLVTVQSSSTFQFYKATQKHILERMEELIKKKLEEQEIIDKIHEDAILKQKRLEKRNEHKAQEMKRILQVIDERATQHAEKEIKNEVSLQNEQERFNTLKRIIRNESLQWKLVLVSTIILIVLVVVYILFLANNFAGLLIGITVVIYAIILGIAYKMTRLKPKKISQKEIIKLIAERQIKIRDEALENLKQKEMEFEKIQKQDRKEKRQRKRQRRESQLVISDIEVMSTRNKNNNLLFLFDEFMNDVCESDDDDDEDDQVNNNNDDNNNDSMFMKDIENGNNLLDKIIPPLPPSVEMVVDPHSPSQPSHSKTNQNAHNNKINNTHNNYNTHLYIKSLSLVDILIQTHKHSTSTTDHTITAPSPRSHTTTDTHTHNTQEVIASVCYLRILNNTTGEKNQSHDSNNKNPSENEYRHFISSLQLIHSNNTTTNTNAANNNVNTMKMNKRLDEISIWVVFFFQPEPVSLRIRGFVGFAAVPQ